MSDTAATVLANDPQEKPLSPMERVVNTFIEPSATFKDIKRNRSWWLPFLIMVILGYGFCYAVVQHIGWDALVNNAIRSNPRSAAQMEKTTPAQQAQTFAITKGFIEGFMAGSPVVILVMNALFALLLWAGFAFVLGGSTNFAEMFAVSIFASLPNALNSIVAIVTAFVSEPQGYNLNVPSPSSLAYFLGTDAAPWLVSLAKSLDIFTLWSLILAGFGGALVARVKPARGVAMVLIVWVLFVLVKVGITGAFS